MTCKWLINQITNPNPPLVTDAHDSWCQKWDWIEAIIRQKIYFTVAIEFPKAMLAKMDANMKTM
jgi:hypothetical protein